MSDIRSEFNPTSTLGLGFILRVRALSLCVPRSRWPGRAEERCRTDDRPFLQSLLREVEQEVPVRTCQV